MKFRINAIQKPSIGIVYKEPALVVPNQALTLHEILTRFTRNEALPIGQQVQYHEGEDDLGKLRHMDLVDKQEYIDKLENVKKAHEKQEKAKAAKARKALEDEERAKIRKELEAEKGSGSGAKAE